MKYGEILGVLTVLIALAMAISSVSAGNIWVHTYGNDYVSESTHWISPNGFEFKDNTSVLDFTGAYYINFFDNTGKKIFIVYGEVDRDMQDRCIHIPNNAVTMDVYVASNGFYEEYLPDATKFLSLKAEDGAMAFGGNYTTNNFHLKTKNFDTGHIKIKRMF